MVNEKKIELIKKYFPYCFLYRFDSNIIKENLYKNITVINLSYEIIENFWLTKITPEDYIILSDDIANINQQTKNILSLFKTKTIQNHTKKFIKENADPNIKVNFKNNFYLFKILRKNPSLDVVIYNPKFTKEMIKAMILIDKHIKSFQRSNADNKLFKIEFFLKEIELFKIELLKFLIKYIPKGYLNSSKILKKELKKFIN